MLALVVQPGHAHTTRIEEVPALHAREGEVLVRTLEVGVCGTDREISDGLFGIPPQDEPTLVLGHEALAVVEPTGYGFTRGELVTATVRRSCGHCVACAEDSPDSCLTGDYSESGITRLHGYARELVADDPTCSNDRRPAAVAARTRAGHRRGRDRSADDVSPPPRRRGSVDGVARA